MAIANARDREGYLLYNVIGIDISNEVGKQKAASLNDGVRALCIPGPQVTSWIKGRKKINS